jgi:hypothetical protein
MSQALVVVGVSTTNVSADEDAGFERDHLLGKNSTGKKPKGKTAR